VRMLGLCLGVLSLLSVAVCAGEGAAEKPAASPAGEQPAAKPAAPPLPLHSLEGFSGVYLTETAYFANAPEGDAIAGKPCFAFSGVRIGRKDLQSLSMTVNLKNRVEFGYSLQRLSLGDLGHDVRPLGLDLDHHSSILHTAGLRVMLVREGEGGNPWVPAITAGVRFKKNATMDNINDDLAGVPRLLGYRNDQSVDYTLTASKTVVGVLPKPFIVSAGLRNTEAIHAGFVGFAKERHTVFECHGIFFLTDRLVLAAEYRQMPRELRPLGRLVRRPDDWWSLAFAYVINEHATATWGFAHLGSVLNHRQQCCPLVQFKWEF